MSQKKLDMTLQILIPLLVMVAVMVGILFYYNMYLGYAFAALYLYLVYYLWNLKRTRDKRWEKTLEKLTLDMDAAARYSVLNLPFPLVLVDIDGTISWYNSKFQDMIEKKNYMGEGINKIFSSMDMEELISSEEDRYITLRERTYLVKNNLIKIDTEQEQYIVMLYFLDRTDYYQLMDRYRDEKMTVALIQVDNYDDVLNETKEEKRPFVTSEIDKLINLWASRMNAVLRKYQKDRYIVIFEKKYLENLEAKRFSLLDDMREIEAGNKFPITLSLGIGCMASNPNKLEEEAFNCLELALGRGGDQAVVNKEGNYEFYGGKSKAVEKRNRVKARIIAHALRPLIDESSQVIIMGHRFPDMDAYGAAIGMCRAALNRGKDAFIVLNEVNEAIRNVHAVFSDNEDYQFLTTEEALDKLDDRTLLVIVDTHRPSFTEAPELLPLVHNKVLLDHHRRGTEFIEDTVLKYLEPYASSTSELVSEVLSYLENKVHIEKEEAEALLAGIVVDTKNFTVKTGVRTFEAASFLRRFGADTTNVRQLFQDDLSTLVAKSEVIKHAMLYRHDVAISVVEDDMENIQLIAAQGADALLNIRGVESSFVIGKKSDGMVFISGRSLGDTNVQVILEQLGGGGHMSVAGAQFQDKTLDEVRSLLEEAIDTYFEEEGDQS